ncbi:LPXTG-motif cell wall anchor domain-containing protein [Micromonospora pattaloongensis]|uniref:LPXTG-motif cell wall anchor domain-containing protein n=1 Tax=Micromonospora pattaloongensis TaxID=405436 RepID=A0A1H3SAR7_9ACTN|nr:LPXTG cell wall anchor domain-containing protein [Micromonospora pattaloongensis]SDZ35183.1 LPXTG-motif cell wall anchor domain-containing protein [Micromonospora pattaloongensis]
MTDVQSARTAPSRKGRLLAGLSTAGLVGTLITPTLGVGPAAAAPCATTAPYGATATADLVKLGLLDLHPLGLDLGPVADVRIASTSSGMNGTGPVNSQAGARQIDAKLLGVDVPLGPLSQALYQQAPPANAEPATATTLAEDLGVLRLGVGNLKAHATWIDGMECGAETGDASASSSTIVDVDVLPGSDDEALVRLPGNLTSSTETGLTVSGGAVRSTATARIGVADVRLFAGSESEVTVKVLKPPTLTVGTAGTAASGTVDYTNPILEISGPNIPTQRIEAPGQNIDIALPSSLAGAAKARSLAESEKLPLLGGTPLDSLLKGLDIDNIAGARTAKTTDAPLPLPKLAKLPNVPGMPVVGDEIGDTEAAPIEATALSVLRLSIGDLVQEITEQSVRAQAASLRLQLLATDGTNSASVVDLGIGLLDATAVAPAGQGGGVSPDEEPDPSDDGGAGGGLPVTGASVGAFAGAGALLVVGGAALLFFTRRRRLS